MMGGRAAEELFIGEVSTGASNDLKQATDIAKLMVRDYGMSSLGPVALGVEQGPGFLRGARMPEMRSYSEQTARIVDEEIRKMVTEALDRAREVLSTNREKVEALAARLLATEVVDEDDLARHPRPQGRGAPAACSTPRPGRWCPPTRWAPTRRPTPACTTPRACSRRL